MSKQSSGAVVLLWGVVILAAVGAAWLIWQKEKAASPSSTAVTLPSSSSTATAAQSPTGIQHPINEAPAGASTVALPPLESSDSAVLASLLAMAGDDALKTLLVPEHIVPRIVATVDALPKQSVGLNLLPLRTPTGSFVASHDDNGQAVLSEHNGERYATYLYVAKRMNPKAVVSWYKRYYPLFQQSYRDLGYADGYFNDRLVAVIDHLLAAPEPHGPVALVHPKAAYEFADPSLQSLSAGQKFMIRLGPAGEAQMKSTLRAIREGVIAPGQ
ncbi:hypothetical protein FHW69_001849 [Luteibacter sp. Sphag1AF]|uniref:DUF3014 domain-containing protein n=1 Tax=Luteibacter sp. Sphag1AF TaxID=2587031 RepID=UPI00161ED98F|nr:DUF3014 domain-containing protein [Luteibacter sp. Sphag1AF]MBB3227248.1 hypothetical protein [Luteibacter sp. Sphag1AF]